MAARGGELPDVPVVESVVEVEGLTGFAIARHDRGGAPTAAINPPSSSPGGGEPGEVGRCAVGNLWPGRRDAAAAASDTNNGAVSPPPSPGGGDRLWSGQPTASEATSASAASSRSLRRASTSDAATAPRSR